MGASNLMSKNYVTLQCDEVGESKFLGADLRMKSEQADAAVWTAESCPGASL